MATRIARNTKPATRPAGEVVEYKRNRPLTTISTSPRVLLVLNKLGKNKSGRFSRYALRYNGQIEEVTPEVLKDFDEADLQAVAERLYTIHGWHDRIAETVVTDDDFLRMLKPDEDTGIIRKTIQQIRKYRTAGRSIKTLALIEELERRIADIRTEERERKNATPIKRGRNDVETAIHARAEDQAISTAPRPRKNAATALRAAPPPSN